MFLCNYGGCAVFVREKTYTVNLSDFIYEKVGTTLILKKYTGHSNVVIPRLG